MSETTTESEPVELTEWRVTFGSRYSYEPHPTFPAAHPDGWLTVCAPNYGAARTYTVGLLWTAWSDIHAAADFEDTAFDGHVYYPRGELARHEVTTGDAETAHALGKSARAGGDL